jgi:DNA-binding IclR family transcriptional regulator
VDDDRGAVPRTGRVQSLERAVALLEAVAAGPRDGLPVARLAADCGLNRATAWRLLATLEDHGLVDRDPAGNRYTVGFAVTRLAASAGVGGLVRRAHPVLLRVSEQTGVSAPVLDAAERPVAVLSVWGPSDRVTVERFPELGSIATTAAAEIARTRYVAAASA